MGEDELSGDWPAKIRRAAGQPDPPDLTVPSAMPSAMRQLPKMPSPPKVSVDLSRTAKPYTEPFVEKLLAQLCQLLVTTAELQSAPRFYADMGLHAAFAQGYAVAAGMLRPDAWWKIGKRQRPRPELLNPAIRLLRTELFRVAPELGL